ncbi:MAG TPA: Re/Si-specific NAD(P)(+) transhydrogenase subunit alpha [Longimicrobiaceae bacterium]|nr:Re/Si-specific NAD(P)(+) transhydrogenase subunit alpha [Longimicrobiaceae bacterium]
MKVVVARETAPGERRVALTPDAVAALQKAEIEVWVERGAGEAAGFPDAAYETAGAQLAEGPALYSEAEVVTKVQRPAPQEAELLAPGTTLICLLPAPASAELIEYLDGRGVNALALERVPRITRAQSMDVLSSQATIAGYKAVLLGAAELPRILPMLTTAAGNVPPAKVFIIGAGVAGLQAIATARRLGAVVSGFDIRPAAAEQVRSLGASFVAAETVSESAEAAGGYAREQTEEERERTMDALRAHFPDQDLVITTAAIPGRPAPRLITADMVRQMRPGSVIVDLAAETGGNCEATVPGERVQVDGVTIVGPLNLPSTVPLHASQMFSKNVQTLLKHLIQEGGLMLDPQDEIVGPMLLTQAPAAPAARTTA